MGTEGPGLGRQRCRTAVAPTNKPARATEHVAILWRRNTRFQCATKAATEKQTALLILSMTRTMSAAPGATDPFSQVRLLAHRARSPEALRGGAMVDSGPPSH